MDLADFMAREKLDDQAMSVRLANRGMQKSRSRISRYRRKLEPIPGDVVKELVEMSGGKMTANELLGISEAAE